MKHRLMNIVINLDFLLFKGFFMANELKKYIDGLVRRKLKENNGSYEKAGIPLNIVNKIEEINYSELILQLVSINVDKYFPESHRQSLFFEFLCHEILYKQSVKTLVDSKHLIVDKELKEMGVDGVYLEGILRMIKEFDVNKLDYYKLFHDEISRNGNIVLDIQEKVDSISEDSSQGTVISHSVKMTSPDCKYPRLFVYKEKNNDGYIRTGNDEVEFDLHINATKLKVFKFLSLKYKERNILDLIRDKDYISIAIIFSASEKKSMNWVEDFQSCISHFDERSHQRVKQVYFPFDGIYHQLSILQPSGLIFLLKNKIDMINDRSPQSFYGKKARKDGKYFNEGYSSLVNLTVTKHGGDHPKNISGLNNKHQSYYLLSSQPPTLKIRNVRFPTVDFFSQTLRYYHSKDLFLSLHKLFSHYKNDWHIRNERDDYYQAIIDVIIEQMWSVRSVAAEQFNRDSSRLNKTQRIWLCEVDQDRENDKDDWLDKLTEDIARYIFNTYEKILGKKAFMLSDSEFNHIHKQVVRNKEALR